MLSKTEAKYIQSLSQKKFRETEGLYIAEGPKIIKEALNQDPVIVKKLYVTEDWLLQNSVLGMNTETIVVAEHELQRISQLKTPNQAIALVQLPRQLSFIFNREVLSLALDGIQDPGNLGTIIRIADWFGIKQIICSPDCADAYGSKVVQATMGSIFRVNLLYTHLEDWLKDQSGCTIYGAALEGTPLKKFRGLQKGIIVIGNESKGIRNNIMPFVQQKITIEKFGDAESLNAAVAIGIILSHVV